MEKEIESRTPHYRLDHFFRGWFHRWPSPQPSTIGRHQVGYGSTGMSTIITGGKIIKSGKLFRSIAIMVEKREEDIDKKWMAREKTAEHYSDPWDFPVPPGMEREMERIRRKRKKIEKLLRWGTTDPEEIRKKKRKLGDSIRKHPTAFLISFMFWSFVSGGNAIGGYLPVFHYYMGDPVVATIFIVGGLVGIFLLSWIFTAIWATFMRVMRGGGVYDWVGEESD